MSIAERKLWTALRGRRFEGLKFRRQYAIGRFIADLACLEARLIIDVDGESHDLSGEADGKRTELLSAFGFHVLRFKNEDVLFRFDGVLREIFDHCVRRAQTPSP